MKKIRATGKSVLLIGDTHLPYEHPDYLEFIKDVSKKFNCKIHIHMGDYEDHHAISFHDSDCELLSAGDELKKVIHKTEDWYKAFPKMITIDSNHGSLVLRRLKKHGVPISHLKPLKEIYKTKTWTWVDEIILKTKIGDVFLCHGRATSYQKLAREIGCSAAQGHYHGKLEVTWCNSVFNERFNMFVGCGIDFKSMAFAYGKINIVQPILGCGVIDEKGYPYIIKMPLNKKGRYEKKKNNVK